MRRKQNCKKKIILITIILMITWILGVYLYTTYTNIEISDSEYEAQKTLSTENEQTVETVEENSTKIADIIEKTTESVVGISKLKSAGNSIFGTSNEEELGLGTGIIITEDGYILSNEHVTGERYSKCYITLEDGKKYTGTVMWSDDSVDLSITKIEAKNLKYIRLGDRKSNRI